MLIINDRFNKFLKLSYGDVCDIVAARGKISGVTLAKKYNVSSTQISRIQLNKSWREE